MTYWIKIVLKILVTMTAVGSLSICQDLEVFEQDDYLDPRDLAETVSLEPQKTGAFVVSSALVGFDNNYQFRDVFSNARIAFLRSNNSLYHGLWQGNLKVSVLEVLNSPSTSVPRFKTRVQLAAYSGLDTSMISPPLRYQISWNAEQIAGHGLVHEIELSYGFTSSFLKSGQSTNIILAVKPKTHEYHIATAGRSFVAYDESGLKTFVGLGIAYERKEKGWRWGVLRFDVLFEIPILDLNSASVMYAASCHLARGLWNHELGIFFQIHVFSDLF